MSDTLHKALIRGGLRSAEADAFLATPAGAALDALVEAAERYADAENDDIGLVLGAVDALREEVKER